MSEPSSTIKGQIEDARPGVMPSAFMRDLRPEYYSDTEAELTVTLRADEFEYHLETLTARNQTHNFELFARKLCERAICPNLRCQTGPEGGGDSKVDTETLPVSEEIHERYYEGIANNGSERWAFAISAEKRWTEKARRDVAKIAKTTRGYKRIFFVTSRHARAKDRARLEDELTRKYGISITIHDRTWLVDETISKDRSSLAHTFLNIGEANSRIHRLGPNDYSRTQQLEDIESEILVPENFAGMEAQLASEALAAAKLSRNLERPRSETDGRFVRAVRLAEKYGTSRQKLEAHYEQIWTALWWFDDFEFLLREYESFESQALISDNAIDLEWLGNLQQLLVNGLLHGHLSEDEAMLHERSDRLGARLQILAEDWSRPNNRLEALGGLLRIQLNKAAIENDRSQLPSIWSAYADLVKAARGLGEFNFDTLVRFIDVAGAIAGNDPAYNSLVETCASAVAERKSESEAALIFLKRAQKLSFDDNFDMIRWLGKAAVGLSKLEHSKEFVEATYRLAVAYRSAGLLWAARSSSVMALATIFIEAERENRTPIQVVAATKLWAWISLGLSHLPDTLSSTQLLNGLRASLPLDDGSKERIAEDVDEIDMALASLILNAQEEELQRLGKLPDLLDGLSLHVARTATLFALGHLDALRSDGTFPPEHSDEVIFASMASLKDQTLDTGRDTPLILNEGCRQSLNSTILGMRVEVHFDETDLIPVAETALGTLEAFFATAAELRIMPHAEAYKLELITSDSSEHPDISTDPTEMVTKLSWPRGLQIGAFDRGKEVRNAVVELAGHVLSAACLAGDTSEIIERFFKDEAVHYRIAMVLGGPNSYSRFNNKLYCRLVDWDKYGARTFELKRERPNLPRGQIQREATQQKKTPEVAMKNHRNLRVRSVIDVPIWNQAKWAGCGYADLGEDLPPFMLLLFTDEEAGRKIFERWISRFGTTDESEEIAIAIIRNLPEWNPHYYVVQVASKMPTASELQESMIYAMPSRSQEMTPATSQNLERFITQYRKFGTYAIMPSNVPSSKSEQPRMNFDLAIEKRILSIKDAAQVSRNDPEAVALNMRGVALPD